MRRAVFDANVWISSRLYPLSIPDHAIGQARDRGVVSVTSPPLIEQVHRSLIGLGYTSSEADDAETEMRAISELVEPTFRLAVITAKESDNRVLECAVAGKADYIVTGDRKHLLRLGEYEGIPIISPREFVDTLDVEGR